MFTPRLKPLELKKALVLEASSNSSASVALLGLIVSRPRPGPLRQLSAHLVDLGAVNVHPPGAKDKALHAAAVGSNGDSFLCGGHLGQVGEDFSGTLNAFGIVACGAVYWAFAFLAAAFAAAFAFTSWESSAAFTGSVTACTSWALLILL